MNFATFGGGNHFIEADRDKDDFLYFVIYSGSRHLGKDVAEYYQEQAYRVLNGTTQKDIDLLTAQLKKVDKSKQIPNEIVK